MEAPTESISTTCKRAIDRLSSTAGHEKSIGAVREIQLIDDSYLLGAGSLASTVMVKEKCAQSVLYRCSTILPSLEAVVLMIVYTVSTLHSYAEACP